MTSFSIRIRETNQNLHTYEFMMGQYKKLAKVTPVIQNQNNQPLEEELKRIANSIKSIESREGTVTNELHLLKAQLTQDKSSKSGNNGDLSKIAFLEGDIKFWFSLNSEFSFRTSVYPRKTIKYVAFLLLKLRSEVG